MNIQILTSSYPAHAEDPSGTAGLFVRAFAIELQQQGHRVIIQPVARKPHYTEEEGLTIEPLPWRGGDRELASLNLWCPLNWLTIVQFFIQAKKTSLKIHEQYQIDRTLCMWAIPSGIFGYWINKKLGKPYDIWALGSDIWKIRKIPIFGNWLLRKVLHNADHVFADGLALCESVKKISGQLCEFLPSSRQLPKTDDIPNTRTDSKLHLLFVGRYHKNKGPDILLESLRLLDQSYKERIHIHMYGLGPLKASLAEYITQHNLKKWIDLNDGIAAHELAQQLKRVDYLIIPSRIESIPVIFSDALQMGTPVISTPVGDLKTMIHNATCGLVAEDTTPSALASAISEATTKTHYNLHKDHALKLYQQFKLPNIVQKWLNS